MKARLQLWNKGRTPYGTRDSNLDKISFKAKGVR